MRTGPNAFVSHVEMPLGPNLESMQCMLAARLAPTHLVMLFSTHTAWTTCATLLESEGGLGLPAHAMPEADRQPTPIEHANLDKPLVQAPTPHTPSGRATRGNPRPPQPD